MVNISLFFQVLLFLLQQPVEIDLGPLGVLTVPGVNGLMGSVLEKV